METYTGVFQLHAYGFRLLLSFTKGIISFPDLLRV